MYRTIFNRKDLPFNITPAPQYLFMSRQHREAHTHIMYGIRERKGFIQLTGEVGSGKTTLCRAVLAELGQQVQTALILNPCLTETQLIRAILQDFGLKTTGKDMLKLIQTLNTFLLAKMEAKENVALLIDESQNLSPKLMEQIRLLSNLETTQQKLIQIVLIGQPELRKMIVGDAAINQRVSLRFHLKPLRADDMENYLRHRLRTAGHATGHLFSPPAALEIFNATHGIPREVNRLAKLALEQAWVGDAPKVEASAVTAVVRDLERHQLLPA